MPLTETVIHAARDKGETAITLGMQITDETQHLIHQVQSEINQWAATNLIFDIVVALDDAHFKQFIERMKTLSRTTN